MDEKNEVKENYIKAYIISVLLITWAITIALFINPAFGLKMFSIIMFIPAILAIVFMKIIHKNSKIKSAGFSKKINVKALLFGILYPILFLILCAIIVQFTGIGKLNSQKLFTIKDVITIIITIIVNLFAALGEEYGWRGYLLPELTKIKGKTKSTIIVGIVWALYHVPAVYLLARTTGLSNPLLLCIIQACVVFTFSFSFSYCYYLSGSIIPVLFFHSIWNTLNTTLLGDIYTKKQGVFVGNLLYINGEGILGLVLGASLICWFIVKFKNDEHDNKLINSHEKVEI